MFKSLALSILVVLSVIALGGCGGAPESSSDNGSSSGGSKGNSSTTSSTGGSPSTSSSSSGSVSLILDDVKSGIDTPDIDANATEFYFSYDESASTASRDLALFAINNAGNVESNWGRTYEFLNAENFSHFNPEEKSPFTVSMGLHKSNVGEVAVGQNYTGDLYSLGVNISGPELTKENRPNVVLTLLVDISGSMDEGYADHTDGVFFSLLDVTKHALSQLPKSLKAGDVVNLITFEDTAKTVLTGWAFNEKATAYNDAVTQLIAFGGTNLNTGLIEAYKVANDTFDKTKSNRVILMTDAYINRGLSYPTAVKRDTVINEAEGIYLSGIGIGSYFDDRFLNELTEVGKGTYSAMITPADAKRIMTDGFMRFIDSAVENVQFKLSYPQGLNQLQTAAEDISTVASEVSKTNFSYNSSQFFLEIFDGSALPTDEIILTATFDVGGASKSIEVKKTVEELLTQGQNQIKSALMVTRLAKIIAKELQCSEVMDSGLYGQNISADIFQMYQKAITDYCGTVKK